MSRAWSGGSTTAWRKVRAAVLQRDGHRCRLQLPGCTGHATHAHHTAGKGSGDDPTLLVASCAHCNLTTGEPTGDPQPTPRTRW